jgi:hypothetical protein
VFGGLVMRLPTHLLFARRAAEAQAFRVDDVISTRGTSSWAVFIGKSPIGRYRSRPLRSEVRDATRDTGLRQPALDRLLTKL